MLHMEISKKEKNKLKNSSFFHSLKLFPSTSFLPLLRLFINFTVASLKMPSICHHHCYHKLCGYKHEKMETVKCQKSRPKNETNTQIIRNSYCLTETYGLCTRLKIKTKSYFFHCLFFIRHENHFDNLITLLNFRTNEIVTHTLKSIIFHISIWKS